jgi:hypothetical protein
VVAALGAVTARQLRPEAPLGQVFDRWAHGHIGPKSARTAAQKTEGAAEHRLRPQKEARQENVAGLYRRSTQRWEFATNRRAALSCVCGLPARRVIRGEPDPGGSAIRDFNPADARKTAYSGPTLQKQQI